jgi:CBS-domain-containing membrane protein
MRPVALPDSESAQPYPVTAGHLLSSAAGFAVLRTLVPGEGSSAVAVSLAGHGSNLPVGGRAA